MPKTRDCPQGYKGYTYQRIYAIYLITEMMQNTNEIGKWILYEEKDEDIKLVNEKDNIIKLIQLKYHDTKEPSESMTYDSGFYKVFKSHYESNVNEIQYISVNEKGEGYANVFEHYRKIKDEANEINQTLIRKFLIKSFSKGGIGGGKYETIIDKLNDFDINSIISEFDKDIQNIISKKDELLKTLNSLNKNKDKRKYDELHIKINQFGGDIQEREIFKKLIKWIAEVDFIILKKYIDKFKIIDGLAYNEIIIKIKNNLATSGKYKNIFEKFHKLHTKCNDMIDVIESHLSCIYGLFQGILVDNLFSNKNETGTPIIKIVEFIDDKLKNIKKGYMFEHILDGINYLIGRNTEKNYIDTFWTNIIYITITDTNTFQLMLNKLIQLKNKNEINADIIPNIFAKINDIYKYNALADKHVIGFLKRYHDGQIKGYSIDREKDLYSSMEKMCKTIKKNIKK